MDRIITIGRQFGSGGHESGKRLAEKLGIPFYDKEILTLAAENSHFAESYLKKIDEQRPNFLSMGMGGITAGSALSATSESFVNHFYHLSPNDQAFLEIGKVMKELASQGPCVIAGRCADYVLRDFNPIKFFLTAELEDRIKRKIALEEHAHLDLEQMGKLINTTDRNRSKYYEYYTHEKWGMAANYHLCINTSSVGVDGAVELMYLFLEEFGKKTLMPDM